MRAPSPTAPSPFNILASYSNVSPFIGTIRCVQGSVVDYGFDHAPHPRVTVRCHGGNTQQHAPHVPSALVNAANTGCIGGGGVDGAISRAGGAPLHLDRLNLPVISTGDSGYDEYVRDAAMFAAVRCLPGEAVITGPNRYNQLQVPYVIHAVGPDYRDYGPQEIEHANAVLTSAYQQSLHRATEHSIRRVGFSLLSAGIFRAQVPLLDVLQVAVQAIRSWVPRQEEAPDGKRENAIQRQTQTNHQAFSTSDESLEFSSEPLLEEVTLCAFTEEECEALLDACRAAFSRLDSIGSE